MAYLLYTDRDGPSDGNPTSTVSAPAICRVGKRETSHLPILDPGSGAPTTLVVAWQHVAAAMLLGGVLAVGVGELLLRE